MRRLWLDMQAAFAASEQVYVWLLCWGCCALAVSIANVGGFARTGFAAAAFCVPCLGLASMLASGARTFARDAEGLRLPGVRAHGQRMRCVAFGLTAIPVAAASWVVASTDAWQAWTPALISLAVVLAGMIVPLRSPLTLTLLIGGLLLGLRAGRSVGEPPGGGDIGSSVVCAALAFAVAMQWRRLQRHGPPGGRSERLQELLRRALPARWRARVGRPRTSRARTARAPDAAPGGRMHPAAPLEVVRVLLGAPFSTDLLWPPSALGAMSVLLMLVWFLAAGGALPLLGSALPARAQWTVSMGASVLIAVIWLWQSYARRIVRLRRNSIGDVMELALMPGLDGAHTQRRSLLRAALMPPLRWLAFILLLGAAALAWEGAPPLAAGVLALFLLGSWATYAARVLRTFAIPRAPATGFPTELLIYYFTVYTPIASHGPLASDFPASWHWWIWAGPVVFAAGIAFDIIISARRLLLAPHPFLIS